MRTTNYKFTTIFFLLFVALTANAQKITVTNREGTIETTLGNTKGIYSDGLDFNEFFTSATITARVKTNKEGEATRINIRKCKVSSVGNCDEKSLNTAKNISQNTRFLTISNSVPLFPKHLSERSLTASLSRRKSKK